MHSTEPTSEGAARAVRMTLGRPSAAPDVATVATLREIEELRGLTPGWDGEGAAVPSDEVISAARNAVELVFRFGSERWRPPNVSPTSEGGVQLSWEVESRWAMLAFQPNQSSVECSWQEDEQPPRYQVESGGDAVERALWALGSSQQ